jgi:benzoate/toluate 1,2-dioxygenase alpha subunit
MIPIHPVSAGSSNSAAVAELDLDSLLIEDDATGDYRLHRSAFTDERLFELEMKHIFEGNWIYLAHESQIPNNNDYYTTQMGRQPVFIARNRQGELNAFINACSHRGAQLCRLKRGNKATYTCPFHGWTFNNSGKLLKVKDPEDAGYPDSFNKDGSHDLKKVARFANYKGFLFGSLNPDVPSIEEFLGEAAKIIDMIVNQSPDGLEVLRGASTYTFEGNWKLQAENGADGYHVSAVHWNYAATTNRRKEAPSAKTRSAPWTPANGDARAAASTPSTTATCCSGPSGPIPKTGRTIRATPSMRRSTASRPRTGWSNARATSACTRMSI